MGALGYFILRDLLHNRWRSLLTILGLAVVVFSYLILAALSQAFTQFGRQPQISSNLVIISADSLDPMESYLDENVLQTALDAAPGQILSVFPTIFRHMSIQGVVMQVRAVPLEHLRNSMALTLLQGEWPEGPQQVVVSEGAVQITSWKLGTTVPIYGADFLIVGEVRGGGNKFASIWMTYPDGQNLFGISHGFQIGTLVLEPSVDPETLRARLQADPHFLGKVDIYLDNTLTQRYNQINHDLQTLSLVQALISLLAITFGIYNAVNLTLSERSREILLLRMIGFNQARLQSILFAHTLTLTSAAYSLGWLAAALFIGYQRLHAPISIQAAPLVLNLSVQVTLFGFLLTIAFSSLGIWLTTAHLPALRLSMREQ